MLPPERKTDKKPDPIYRHSGFPAISLRRSCGVRESGRTHTTTVQEVVR